MSLLIYLRGQRVDFDRDLAIYGGYGGLDGFPHGGFRRCGADFEAVSRVIERGLCQRERDGGKCLLAHRLVLGVFRHTDDFDRRVQLARPALGAERMAYRAYTRNLRASV